MNRFILEREERLMKIYLNFKVVVFSVIILWACNVVNADTYTLSNPNASIEANDVYNWLSHMPRRHDNKLLSGAFGGYAGITNSDAFSMDEANVIYGQTGQYPAIYACDYARGWDTTLSGDEADLIDYSCNNDLITYWQNGGLVQISNHLPNPVFAGNNINPKGDPQGGLKHSVSNKQFFRILTTGTAERARWLAILDKVADGLLDLQVAGVTVIYRPLHEMNGEWFWWGGTGNNTNDTTRHALFKDLYIDMYNYFTSTKQLNNLIWVYSPDSSRDYKSSYYPGGAYVDIVGLDLYKYHADIFTAIEQSHYDEMLQLNKPFAIAETGPKEDIFGNFPTQYDYSKLVDTIKSKYPETIYFLPWNDKWSPINNLNLTNTFRDSGVANRNDIRNGSQLTNIIEDTTMLYSFEPFTYDLSEWGTNSSSVLGYWVLDEWAGDKKYSLKANIDLQSNRTFNIYSSRRFNFTGKSIFSAKIKLAHWGNVGQGLEVKLYIKTGSNYQWFDGGITTFNNFPQHVSNTQQQTLSLDLSNVTNRDDIREIGIEVTTPQNSSGQSAIYIDSVIVQE